MSGPTESISLVGRARGCLLGLAVGDAVGVSVEFQPRGTFEPVTDMTGGGPFDLEPGQWTDDTSLALCLADSLIECGGFDAADQLERYVRWYRDGYRSVTGHCFDIGHTTRAALERFERIGDPRSGSTASNRAGNGSIMRLAPIPLFFHPDREAVDRYAAESSRTTHGADEAVAGCRVLAAILTELLAGAEKVEATRAAAPASWMSPRLADIAERGYADKGADVVRGSGYVADCLEAALWCFDRTNSFRDAILTAANLGDDADTTAAVCGQLAGAYYGESGIPTRWRDRVALGDEIASIAERLLDSSPSIGALRGVGGAQ